MSEDEKLLRLEEQWQDRFDRFTAPEPTREDTFRLIEKIKATAAPEPIDLRAELEKEQIGQSFKEKALTLFLSQWTFHGGRSWLLTALIMLILTITISFNMENEMTGFIAWIKWVTLGMIAMIGYAFRPNNEGNATLEKVSFYPVLQQMFARFSIVMGLQFLIALPMLFFIVGLEGAMAYIVSFFVPLFFFGVVGFVSTIWLGQKNGLFLTLSLWAVQILLEPTTLYEVTKTSQFTLLIISILLLLSIPLRFKRKEI